MSPNTPIRSSSKRPLQTNNQLDYQLFQTQRDFKKIKKELKPRTSFDSDYWEQAMKMASLGRTSSQLELHKAANNYVAAGHGSEEDFMSTQTARPLQKQLKVWETKQKVYRSRATELKTTNDPERTSRRVFMKLFTSSPLGLNIKEAVAGRRETRHQSNFRDDIIKKYNLTSSKEPSN